MPFVTRLPALTGADPYPDALLALDFVGSRRGPQYYKALGVTTADITKVPGWTYTGGASTGSYAAKADGSLQLFAQNVPRFTDAGYWAEEARTNLLLRSQEFDNGSWITTNSSVLANQIAAPDGTTTAEKLNETAVTGVHQLYQDITKAASALPYTLCVYAKSAERNTLELSLQAGASGAFTRVNLDTGGLIANSGYGAAAFTSVSTAITPAPNGFWRVCFTATTDTSTTLRSSIGNYVAGSSYTGTAGFGIYIWQADLQAGAFATSPIPTTSVAVTRAADVGYVSGLVVPSAFTFSIQPVPNTVVAGSFPYSIALSDGTNNNRFEFYSSATNAVGFVASGGATQYNVSVASALSAGVAARDAMSVNGTTLLRAMNGVARTGGTLSSSPASAVTRLEFKTGSASYCTQRVIVYRRALSDAELQAITTAGAY